MRRILVHAAKHHEDWECSTAPRRVRDEDEVIVEEIQESDDPMKVVLGNMADGWEASAQHSSCLESIMKSGLLSLGTRKDATTWAKGCTRVGFDVPLPIKQPNPGVQQLRRFFGTSPEWVFLAGHFGEHTLFNEDGSVQIEFASGHVECTAGGKTEKILKNRGFSLHADCRVVLWGGCSVCHSEHTVRTLRALFGQHVMLGFAGSTGWRVVDAILGGGFITKEHFFERVRDKCDDLAAVRDAWMKTARAGYGNGRLEGIFRAVDPDGQEWILRKGELMRDRVIS